jgi:PAS domain S-box-containing protein
MELENERAGVRPDASFLEGGGELGALIRAHDWSKTPLGPVEHWPQSLRSAVSILLPSRAQIALFWGPELVTLYNDAYRPVFGAKHPRALGMPIRESWSELWSAGLREVFEAVLQTGEAFWARDRAFLLERHGYREETFFDVSYDPVRDESGRVGGVFCIVSETTGRVLGDRRVRTLRELAGATASARSAREACAIAVESLATNPHDVPFVLLKLGDAREPAAASKGAEALAARAWPSAGLDSKAEIVPLDGAPDAIPRGVWPRPPSHAAILPLGKRAHMGSLVIGLNPFRAFDDDYRGFLDLVAQQVEAAIANARAHEDERQRTAALAELDRAKTAFFSNVSHEFRTPLTLMLGPLEDVLRRSDLAPADREKVEVAYRNSLRLLKLVNTLLDFSRIEAGRFEASYEPTELGRRTAELASVFRSAVERAGLRYLVDCPPLDEPAYVDAEMWEKIVFNLLSNAFKFTVEGSIEVTLRRRGERVELRVTDTGSGIPREDLPHVFERFHRVRGARGRTFEGSGIGLALVHELVKLQGGTLEVQSELGRGSTFSVSLPLGAAHLDPQRVGALRTLASTELRVDAFLGELSGWRASDPGVVQAAEPREDAVPLVLFADDNADMREYVRGLLGEHYDVVLAADGAAALRIARERSPSLILADVMMPELDGFELMRAIRADDRLRSVPIILLSARAGEEARLEGIEAGADDYIVKPFSARELLVRVASRLELGGIQARLERDRAELAGLFAQAPMAIAVLRGPDLVFELANPAAIEMLDHREAIGRPLLEVVPELAGQGFEVRMREVMRTGVPHVGREELTRLERRGRIESLYFTFVHAPLRNAEGRIEGVIVVAAEVTPEVRAREAIGASEARYRHIFATAGVAILEEDFTLVRTAIDELAARGITDFRAWFEANPDFVRRAIELVRLVDANDSSLRLFGARDKAELARSLSRLVQTETEAAFAGQLAAIAEGRPFFEAETAIRTISGEQRSVHLTVAFPRDELASVLVTLMDITERKNAERALLEQAHTLETLNGVGMTLAAERDLERIVQKVTDAGVALSEAEFGAFFYNVNDKAGESYTLFTLSGAPREAFAKFGMPRNTPIFAPTFTGRAVVRLDDVTKDPRYGQNPPHHGMPPGHLPVRSYLAVPVVSRSGETFGGLFLGHSRPAVFTERAERIVVGIASQAAVAIDNARLHEQRLHLIGRLREADRRKDEFLATLSHELRNPLAPLRNSLHLLRLSENGASAPVREMMERQLTHLVRLVDDLLEMSRISRGAFELRKERVELASVTRSAVEASGPLIHAARHELEVSLPPEPLWVEGDPVRLAQVLSNLLNNAAKYTEPRGRIALTVARVDGLAEVTVRDNGAGISAEAMPRVFEMFSRGDQPSGYDHGGLGIGLALARRLVEMHGGTIAASSEGRGRGSEFVVKLPIAADQVTGTPAERGIGTMLQKKKTLVVDDNRDSAESLGMLLDFLGADVRMAFDGTEALAVYPEYDPEVVLLDIGMPGMDGYAVVRKMRAEFPERTTVIVALTGWGQEEDRRLAREAGFDHHLIKPADIDALKALLGSIDRP